MSAQPRWDRWSFVHAGTGALLTTAFWATGIKWFALLITWFIEILWEIYENGTWQLCGSEGDDYGGGWFWKGCSSDANSWRTKWCAPFVYMRPGPDSIEHTVWDVIITTSGGLFAGIFLDTTGLGTGALVAVCFAGAMYAIFILFYIFRGPDKGTVYEHLSSSTGGLKGVTPVYALDGLVF